MTVDDVLVMYAKLKGKDVYLTDEEKKEIQTTNSQIEKMIAENERLIKEGDNVEGRERLISALKEQLRDENAIKEID